MISFCLGVLIHLFGVWLARKHFINHQVKSLLFSETKPSTLVSFFMWEDELGQIKYFEEFLDNKTHLLNDFLESLLRPLKNPWNILIYTSYYLLTIAIPCQSSEKMLIMILNSNIYHVNDFSKWEETLFSNTTDLKNFLKNECFKPLS